MIQGSLPGMPKQLPKNHGHDEVSTEAAKASQPTRQAKCRAALERLRRGPATARELTAAGAGDRPAARIYDLRQQQHKIDSKRRGGGCAVYTLRQEAR